MFPLNFSKDDCLADVEKFSEKILSPVQAVADQVNATQNCWSSFVQYMNEFMTPYLLSTNYFADVEQAKLMTTSPLESFQSYMELLDFNLDLSNRYFTGSMKAINDYSNREMQNAMTACLNTLFHLEGEDITGFLSRHAKMMDSVANAYPNAIQEIEPEFGFHFERSEYIKFAETDRFVVYQVLPTDKSVKVNEKGKPTLILPPYVLGANILAFLPGENKSFSHCFANMGIPTYIREFKEIEETPAFQLMTGEEDAIDTKFFCEKIMERHGKPVTLNGYCQGGYMAVCDLLSGELDGVVDALITCVAPMDGTRSAGLSEFMNALPQRFNDLAYATKTLPNGNRVVDGKLMGWVYKLKSIEKEAPPVAFFRDMMMLSPRNGGELKISKTAAAINYWVKNDANDLPPAITKMSFDSYSQPVTDDGTLPVTIFGRKLNFKRIQEKGIKWLICYGEKDDLVEPEVALAPRDYVDVEISAFPKGHVAIATSWSNPKSAYALHTRFGEKNQRGPVRFQLDLDKELSSDEA